MSTMSAITSLGVLLWPVPGMGSSISSVPLVIVNVGACIVSWGGGAGLKGLLPENSVA